MILGKKTLSDIDIKDKRILLRAEYNVPIADGKIADDYRITQSLPTIKYLLSQGCSIAIICSLGRPKGRVDASLSLRVVAEHLGDLIGQEVLFHNQAIGAEAVALAKGLVPGQVMMLENLRFYYQEEADDDEFAQELAKLGDVFVQDAFGNAHRAHASMHAITKYLPSVAGLLLENEVKQITRAVSHPKKPTVGIVGGAKIETKVPLLDNLIPILDRLIIGGAMANTFIASMGMEVGKSLYDEGELDKAKSIIKKCGDQGVQLILPLLDLAVTNEVNDSAERRVVATEDIGEADIILDFGEKSIKSAIENLKDAGTVIWNGPVGMIELKPFRVGSEKIARYIVDNKIDCVVGGGETIDLIDELGIKDGFTHVSTGGGAALKLMSGMTLPAVDSLGDK